MYDERHNPMPCGEFEALITEAIDGALDGPQMERFRGHAASCAACGPLFAHARAGHLWLKGLEEVEPPAYLVQKILNVTTELPARAEERQPAAAVRVRGWLAGLRPSVGVMLQPKFGMSFAMAFFSITLVLNIIGVKLSDLRHVDLRPSSVQRNLVRGYNETTAKVERYYQNLRFVYEVQSTLRDLREATTEAPAQPQPQQQQPQPTRPQDDNTSEKPEQKNQHYSLEKPAIQLAAAPAIESVPVRREA